MPAAFQHQRQVEFRDTDAAGIVHFSVFFVWMEQAEHAALRSLGLSVMPRATELSGDQVPITWPRVAANCDYLRPVRFEDHVVATVAVEKLGTKSVVYRIQFESNDQTVAVGKLTTACCQLGADGQLRSVPIPAFIAGQLRQLAV